jgi:hypothetical protein
MRSAYATDSHGGSPTISGSVFNFTNSIIGAGTIGLGGALFALSGVWNHFGRFHYILWSMIDETLA